MALVHDPISIKLGRRAVRRDPRTLRLLNYVAPSLPPPPASVDWSTKVTDWGMLLNDKIGDCTIAAWAHLMQARISQGGEGKLWTDDDVLSAYEAVTAQESGAYNPKTGANDNGCVELDVLNWLRHQNEIIAYVSIDGRHTDLVKFAIDAFVGVYMGVALPITCQHQDVWDIADYSMRGDAEAGSWGGHAMMVVGYDADTVTFVTWGKTKKATWAWWRAYIAPVIGGECYAIISPDLFGAAKQAPSGFQFGQLEEDMRALGITSPLENEEEPETPPPPVSEPVVEPQPNQGEPHGPDTGQSADTAGSSTAGEH
jgi:hypothetical protein